MKTKEPINTTNLEADIYDPHEIVKKAAKLLQPIKYEPNHIGYFVLLNGLDMGGVDFCENCIRDAVKDARRFHKEERQRIIDKFKEIDETGCHNGVNIKERYDGKQLKKQKRLELKKYPSKVCFSYMGHDPDFCGGETSPKSCGYCGDYFYTDFEPDIEEANYLLEEFGDGSGLSETLKWRLDIAFYNYEYLEEDVQKVLLSIAENIINEKQNYGLFTECGNDAES